MAKKRWSCANSRLPDVVLLDILMPVMDGAAACAHIQALPGGDRVPVLMITALNDKQSIDRCFDAGATDYLTKPINNQVLAAASAAFAAHAPGGRGAARQ